ncbi:phosphotransferase enzyme family protein [Aspergillus coremiiformis]|uniref:Phosphotransferase enzyme family protein n=1 Tax=Aspergillus coremiiformis TaxID=138285 RepID=A0A5N6ZHB6_9EURO|nr:phosphotransferase enzyme family protein [Aspergillus coremiiformis]
MKSLRIIRRATKSALCQTQRRTLTDVNSKPNLPDHLEQQMENPFFSYTSGRWLWDEATQLLRRYQPFNVEELKVTAARSVKAKFCVNMIKLPEGSFNKTFLLTMDNNVQVIAKIPNPYIPQKFATASEVAILDFLRNELGIPVPRVFAWSNKKDQPVGVEYIIMEKAPGHQLSKSWHTMDISDKVDIVSQLAGLQAKIAAVDFNSYGSLFYNGDINGGLNIPGIVDRFCIGPCCEIRFWEEERRHMSEYRGPWASSEEYAKDIARREKHWISRFAKPRHPADPLRQSDSQESPKCHLKLLDQYSEVVSRLLPPDPGLNRSVLWHPDLHAGNIFVQGNRIVSVIDWQGCSSLPIFHACRIPKLLKVHGPLLFDLPDATGLTQQEKEETLQRYQYTQLQKFYISKFQSTNVDVFYALTFPQGLTRQQLIDFAGFTWDEDGLFLLREMMHRVWNEWDDMTGQPQGSCPVTFHPDELASHIAEKRAWEGRRELFDALGIPIDGWVHPDEFEAKVEAMWNLVNLVVDCADDKDSARDALRAWKLSGPGPARLSGKVRDL